MSRTVTALYDTRAEAEAARERLSSEVDVQGRAKIIDKSAMGTSRQAGSSDFHSVPMSHADRHAYGEGLNRGGFMVCAEVDNEEHADRIVSVLEQTSSVDMDERESSWKSEGWQPYTPTVTTESTPRPAPRPVQQERTPVVEEESYEREEGRGGSRVRSFVKIGGVAAAAVGAMAAAKAMKGSDTKQTNHQSETNTGAEEERIPIVEEQLHVGKREVSGGGARVSSHVEEVPVNEQVKLREEHVSVERRPVSGDSSRNPGDAAFQDRNIEMTETSEVPVVEKEARVTEEVVVKKSAQERTENVQDTVRRTQVDVDEDRGTGDPSAMGFGRDGDKR